MLHAIVPAWEVVTFFAVTVPVAAVRVAGIPVAVIPVVAVALGIFRKRRG